MAFSILDPSPHIAKVTQQMLDAIVAKTQPPYLTLLLEQPPLEPARYTYTDWRMLWKLMWAKAGAPFALEVVFINRKKNSATVTLRRKPSILEED